MLRGRPSPAQVGGWSPVEARAGLGWWHGTHTACQSESWVKILCEVKENMYTSAMLSLNWVGRGHKVNLQKQSMVLTLYKPMAFAYPD